MHSFATRAKFSLGSVGFKLFMKMPEDVRRRNGTILAIAVAAFVLVAVIQGLRLGFVPLSWGWYSPIYEKDGVAIEGYDPVAYHLGSKVQLGQESILYRWQDLDWYFISEENKALFHAAPEKYAPEFGGYCAKAVSSGFSGGGNPRVWHIHDGKLYFFFSDGAKESWLAELDTGIVRRSEANWFNR